MVRSSILLVLLVAFAALVGGAAPAFAHAGHKSAHGAASAIRTDTDGARVAHDEVRDAAGQIGSADSIILAAADSGTPCHTASECCTFHCCVSGAVMPAPVFAAAPPLADTTARVDGRVPDDAPRESQLRPPCR